MEEALKELRAELAHLRAEHEQLCSERVQSVPTTGPNAASTSGASLAAASNPSNVDRLIFVPRDKKCPMFRGISGISLGEWPEEAQACMRARHLSFLDQAFFLYDHLEGEAKEEIKYRSSVERSDPNKIISILQALEQLQTVLGGEPEPITTPVQASPPATGYNHLTS